ncbi:MAG: hypothetical protein U0R29_04340 [Solirubrobacterales bacterium]
MGGSPVRGDQAVIRIHRDRDGPVAAIDHFQVTHRVTDPLIGGDLPAPVIGQVEWLQGDDPDPVAALAQSPGQVEDRDEATEEMFEVDGGVDDLDPQRLAGVGRDVQRFQFLGDPAGLLVAAQLHRSPQHGPAGQDAAADRHRNRQEDEGRAGREALADHPEDHADQKGPGNRHADQPGQPRLASGGAFIGVAKSPSDQLPGVRHATQRITLTGKQWTCP